MTQVIGVLAAISAAVIFLPQVIQTLRTKNTKDLSLGTFILANISNSMWLTYGILTTDFAILLSQAFLLPMGMCILICKFKYG